MPFSDRRLVRARGLHRGHFLLRCTARRLRCAARQANVEPAQPANISPSPNGACPPARVFPISNPACAAAAVATTPDGPTRSAGSGIIRPKIPIYRKTGPAPPGMEAPFTGVSPPMVKSMTCHHLTAAHPTMPLPSYAPRVTNLDNGNVARGACQRPRSVRQRAHHRFVAALGRTAGHTR